MEHWKIPSTTPRIADDLAWWVQLSEAKHIGPQRFRHLLTLFPDPHTVLTAPPDAIQSSKALPRRAVEGLLSQRDKHSHYLALMEQQLQLAERSDAHILRYTDDLYPWLLRESPVGPPVLYARGNLKPVSETKRAVAVVGTRRASPIALEFARTLCGDLARSGWCVVSGMAKGIDAAAHDGALLGQGLTAAVLGCGADVVYPRENKAIYERILQQGAVFSQYPFSTRPSAAHLQRRNKLTVGFSAAVVIIQTGVKGGTMNAYRAALDEKKPVFVYAPRDIEGDEWGGNRLILDKGGIPLADDSPIALVETHVAQVRPVQGNPI